MSIPLRFARGGNLARVSIPNVSCKALRLPHTVRLPQKAAYFGSEKWVVDARNQVLGRLCSQVARVLTGEVPHIYLNVPTQPDSPAQANTNPCTTPQSCAETRLWWSTARTLWCGTSPRASPMFWAHLDARPSHRSRARSKSRSYTAGIQGAILPCVCLFPAPAHLIATTDQVHRQPQRGCVQGYGRQQANRGAYVPGTEECDSPFRHVSTRSVSGCPVGCPRHVAEK